MKDLYSPTNSNLTNHHIYEPRSQVKNLLNLIEKVVFSRDSKNLGNIVEIMLDITNGKICYAVLGFMRTPQRVDSLLAIPWDALTYDFERDAYVLNFDKSRLHFAPNFTKDSWPDMTDETWADSIHSFYGTHMKRSNSIHSAI